MDLEHADAAVEVRPGDDDAPVEPARALERRVPPRVLANWRFQQALYRAYYDAYVRARLLHETQLEDEATAALRRAGRSGALKALEEAERVLARAETRPVAEFGTLTITERVDELAPEARKAIFDPVPRVDGIDSAGDPLTEVRSEIYLMSGRRRRAAGAN